jgi:DMSO/TMAO reductase YedYZ molybdopterin-dependent catalytic subunit
MSEQIPLDEAGILVHIGKDRRLTPYGGANFGMPLDLMEPEGALVVPTDRFFVRSNGPVPVVDPDSWALAISGHVERPRSLSLADLRAMERRSFSAVLECAGNGRTLFDPVPAGTPWRYDAAGNARWSGVPLAAVLDLVGVRDGAVDLVAQGEDMPEMRRGLPLAIARDPDTLLVLEMNGAPLTVAHGAPVRLLVPGWAGIASTKWLAGLDGARPRLRRLLERRQLRRLVRRGRAAATRPGDAGQGRHLDACGERHHHRRSPPHRRLRLERVWRDPPGRGQQRRRPYLG